MLWLQENWWIAAIVAVLAILIIIWLVRRPKAASFDIPETVEEAAPPKPAPPPKPLEPKKPEIIAAEPARFKRLEPTPPPPAAAVVPPTAPAPAPTPVAKPAPTPKAEAAPKAAPDAAPAPSAAPAAAAKAPEAAPAIPGPSAAPAATPAAIPAGDNLRLMKGVGPKLVALLANLGITRFEQIAAWDEAEIARINSQLGSFAGRITRDNWVDQAGYLARKDKAGFEAKYGALGGEL